MDQLYIYRVPTICGYPGSVGHNNIIKQSKRLSAGVLRQALQRGPCCPLVPESCLSLCDPMDWSPPGSSVLGVSQARILEWIAMPSSRGSFRPKDWTLVSWVSCIGMRVLYHYCHIIFHYQITTEGGKELRIWKCTGEIFKTEAWPLEKKKRPKICFSSSPPAILFFPRDVDGGVGEESTVNLCISPWSAAWVQLSTSELWLDTTQRCQDASPRKGYASFPNW